MQANVVSSPFTPIDLSPPQESDPASGADDQPLWFIVPVLEILEQRHQAFVTSMLASPGNFCFGTLNRLAKALTVERFQQVVEGMHLESLDCVLIVGCYKNDRGHFGASYRLEHFEAAHLGHLHVQEKQVGLQFRDGCHRTT